MNLQSHYHPHLQLTDHIAQVQQAAHFLLSCHCQPRQNTAVLLTKIVQCHDLGKGSPAFQAYISNNPTTYTGDPRTKSHSLLSAVLATLWAQHAQWAVLDTLVLTQSVACHHAGFKCLNELEDFLALEIDDPLEAQYAALELTGLSEISGLNLQSIKNDDLDVARQWLFKRQQVEKQLAKLPLEQALGFRLWTQFCLSILLEADKALLALHNEGATRYLQKTTWDSSPQQIDEYLNNATPSPMNDFRSTLQSEVMLNSQQTTEKCLTLTVPTGAGKTLLAARWAFTTRQLMASQSGIWPKIIVVLPFLSIIEQTEQIYRQVLGVATAEANTERLMASHSLADSNYELEGESLTEQSAAFFLNTWRAEVVMTTFDQFLLALFSDKTRHLMRFHNLMDAIIILDEVQTLPPKLWDIVNQTLHALTTEGDTRVLMMSATQPQFLSPAQELAGSPAQVIDIFKQCQRYQIVLNHRIQQPLAEFIDHLISRVDRWLAENKRVMITLNTRASAKRVWHTLYDAFQYPVPVYLLSADVTPRDRFHKINGILEHMKQDNPCLVVTTQTVEAGVDIDMDVVIRDFAPLDKIVQVAGRCNRNHHRGQHGGYVEVVSLVSEKGKKYAGYVYDKVLLDVTHETLENQAVIGEEAILPISHHYFQLLHERKNTGTALTEQYAYWQKMTASVHSLLRPQLGEQISFIVLEDEEGETLRLDIEQAFKIQDRWKRRRALQRLAGKINKRSVNVYQRTGFHPSDYAERLGYFWLLKAGYYTEEAGLDLKLDEEDTAVCIL